MWLELTALNCFAAIGFGAASREFAARFNPRCEGDLVLRLYLFLRSRVVSEKLGGESLREDGTLPQFKLCGDFRVFSQP